MTHPTEDLAATLADAALEAIDDIEGDVGEEPFIEIYRTPEPTGPERYYDLRPRVDRLAITQYVRRLQLVRLVAVGVYGRIDTPLLDLVDV